MTTLGELGEFGFIERISRLLPKDHPVLESAGDDCAVIDVDGKKLIATCDLLLENVHFRRGVVEPDAIGWKAAAVNLSDIAAMGGVPRFALVSVAADLNTEVSELEAIYRGLVRAMESFDAHVVGGDTSRSNDGLVIDVALIGDLSEDRYMTRRGAKSGDLLAITGYVGRAAAGLHAQENAVEAPELLAAQYRPVPRVKEGQWLCARPGVHAMIDVSDGVAQDAGHIAEQSKLGVDIRANELLVDSLLSSYCQSQSIDALSLMLHGGEDYELAVAIDAAQSEQLVPDFQKNFDLPLTVIGEFSTGFAGVHVDGQVPVSLGFDHFRGATDA